MVIFHSYVNVYQRVRTMCFHVLLNIVALRLRFRVPLPRSHLPPREVGDDYSKLSLGEHGAWERRLHVQRHLTTFGRENFFKKVLHYMLFQLKLCCSINAFTTFHRSGQKSPRISCLISFHIFHHPFSASFNQWIVPSLAITYFCHRPAMWLQENYQWWVPALAL